MRLRLLKLLVIAGAFVPLVVYAADGSFFGPIVPQGGICSCPQSAPDWGCVLKVLQNVINAGVGIAIIIVVLAIAYAGFIFMTSGANPHARQQGKNLILNSLIGLGLILGAWLAIDFVMKTVYNPNAVYEGTLPLGPWNSIWAAGATDMCVNRTTTRPITNGVAEIRLALRSGTLQGGSGACSPTNVQQWASQAGIAMSGEEAAVLACMAGPESRCGANAGENYCWNQPRSARCPEGASTAYGPYQILLKGNASCFETAACYRAAGVQGSLNCGAAFTSSGYPIAGPLLERCKRAAANYPCSVAAAHCLYQDSLRRTGDGGRPWSGNRDSTAAHQACTIRN